MRLADRIWRIRNKKKLTQDKAAAKAGMTRQQWSFIERGLCQPQADTLDRIARALGVAVGDLFPKKRP